MLIIIVLYSSLVSKNNVTLAQNSFTLFVTHIWKKYFCYFFSTFFWIKRSMSMQLYSVPHYLFDAWFGYSLTSCSKQETTKNLILRDNHKKYERKWQKSCTLRDVLNNFFLNEFFFFCCKWLCWSFKASSSHSTNICKKIDHSIKTYKYSSMLILYVTWRFSTHKK